MSRGGRGRGGGGRGGMFGQGSNLMGDFTFEELRRFSTKETLLFPDIELPATMPPSNKELKYHGYALEYAAQLQASPWYMAEPQASTSSGVEQYSDRFLSKGTHDVSILQQEETMSRLNKEFFPTNLWEPFYERKMAKTQKKKRKVDLDGLLRDVDNPDDNEAEGGGGEGSQEEDEDAAEDDEEDEEEDGDYDNNYFDAGDDDADVDTGQGGDEEGGVM